MLIEEGDRPTLAGRFDRQLPIACHGELIGVNHIGLEIGDGHAHRLRHGRCLVSGCDNGHAGCDTFRHGTHVLRHGSLHHHGANIGADVAQVLNGRLLIIFADETEQHHLMLLGQMTQHVICPHFGSGIERIGQDLSQKQDPRHYRPFRRSISPMVFMTINKSR